MSTVPPDPYLAQPRPPYPPPPYPYPPASPYLPAPPPPLRPHSEPQAYHRIMRTRIYRWWRPALALLVFLSSYALLAPVAFVPWLVTSLDEIMAAESSEAATEAVFGEMTPVFLLSTNLSLAAAMPAAALGVLAGCRLKWGWLGSVLGRLRWRLLWRGVLLAVPVIVVFYGLSFLLPPASPEHGAEPVGDTTLGLFLAYAAVVVLTTPLQAAGEEYAFRGVLVQVLGAWVRWPWVGGVVTSLLFAVAHGGQNPALFTDRFAFGLTAWWLVVRTGGLELSIALHAVNNAVIFLVSAAFGQVEESLAVTSAPWSYVLLDLAQLAVFAALAEWLVVRRRAPQTRTPAEPQPVAA